MRGSLQGLLQNTRERGPEVRTAERRVVLYLLAELHSVVRATVEHAHNRRNTSHFKQLKEKLCPLTMLR